MLSVWPDFCDNAVSLWYTFVELGSKSHYFMTSRHNFIVLDWLGSLLSLPLTNLSKTTLKLWCSLKGGPPWQVHETRAKPVILYERSTFPCMLWSVRIRISHLQGSYRYINTMTKFCKASGKKERRLRAELIESRLTEDKNFIKIPRV